jgi:hypothetical protein
MIQKGLEHYKKCISNNYKGIVYELVEVKFNELNEIQRMLINEVKRFCEEKGYFPNEKELTNKKGYVSRNQFYKHFNTDTFNVVYDVIYPLQKRVQYEKVKIIQKANTMPLVFSCNRCGVEKDFNEKNFSKQVNGKYGLKTICIECENYQSKLRNYKRKGILFKDFEDINPEQWWEYLFQGKIRKLPDFCLFEENIIKIVRHIAFNKLGVSNKGDLEKYGFLSKKVLKKFKIYHLYSRYYNKLNFLQICFPEFHIQSHDLPYTKYNDEVILEIISIWIRENNLSVLELLDCSSKVNKSSRVKSMVANTFDSYSKMMCWYFKKRQIMHPVEKRAITLLDFKNKGSNFWEDKTLRIKAIKEYCEKNEINNCINDTELLKEWVYKYFRQENVIKILNYPRYYKHTYDVLVDAYPKIKDDKILFEWEWHQWSNYDEVFLIKMLKELVFYRMNVKTHDEIPKRLSYAYMQRYYPKVNKIIARKKMKSYYEWAVLAFPEYANLWSKDDFKLFEAKDGSLCGSDDERCVYELLKYDLEIKYIQAVGVEYRGKYSLTLPEEFEQEWVQTDFVIEFIELSGRKYRLLKPIYIEYFGMYHDLSTTEVMIKYRKKTKMKLEFYKSVEDIIFIPIFPKEYHNNKSHDLKKKIKSIMGFIIENNLYEENPI